MRRVQDPVGEILCGFESQLRYLLANQLMSSRSARTALGTIIARVSASNRAWPIPRGVGFLFLARTYSDPESRGRTAMSTHPRVISSVVGTSLTLRTMMNSPGAAPNP